MDPEQIKQAFEERFDSSKMGTLYHLLKVNNYFNPRLKTKFSHGVSSTQTNVLPKIGV